MTSSRRIPALAAVLLRAAAEGRLHRVGQVYRWRPRQAVLRAHTSPGITETGMQLHAFGLISHHPGDTTCALTDRGRELLAAYQEGRLPMSGNRDQQTGRASSTGNPGRELGRALKDARTKADQRRQTGRQA